jgi:hypothetical protein
MIMWFKQWCRNWLPAAARNSRNALPRRRRVRPTLEVLEGRSLPSSLTLANVSPMTTDIHGGHKVLTGSADGFTGDNRL